jgi:Fic family protein
LAIVTKKIKGIEYDYHQTSVSFEGKYVIVDTIIGRKDLPKGEYTKRKWSALEKHGHKIGRMVIEPRIKKYHFENKPIYAYHDILPMEMLRMTNIIFRKSLTSEELEDFERVLFTRYVYGTTAIEGNTYTESEVEKLLFHGLTSNNKTLNETLEITNYLEVRKFVNNYSGLISEQLIKNIHSILMKGIKDKYGRYIKTGKYRTDRARITGTDFNPCEPDLIEDKISYAIKDYYNGIDRNIHSIELASLFHQRFEEIHPFQDGNGRTGREVLNYMLKEDGFPEIYIPPHERDIYLLSLNEGNKSNYSHLIDFICHRIHMSLLYFDTKSRYLSQGTASKEFRDFFESAGSKKQYKDYIDIFNKYRNSGEIP